MERHISEHFSAAEVACKCGECDKATADVELVRLLEEVRAEFSERAGHDVPVFVSSWFRCREHNNRSPDEVSSYGIPGAGSNDNSWHLIGGAADISIPNVEPEDIANYVRAAYPDRYGIGLYRWGVHLDIRPTRGDWDFRGMR